MGRGALLLALFSFAISACSPSGDRRVELATRSDRVATWGEQSKLLPPSDAIGAARFGAAVALSGTTAIVGAPNVSAAYVFVRSGATWTQQAKLVSSDGPGGLFGTSVAINGDTAVVGATIRDTSGAAYVFTRSGTTWTQQAKLVASGTKGMNDGYGAAVAVLGDTALIGAPGASSFRGTAYYFTRSGTTWTERQQLSPYTPVGNDQFGGAVAISPSFITVGAPSGPMGRGRVHFFAPIGISGSWTEVKDFYGDGVNFEHFGSAVATDGDTIAIGQPTTNGVFVYRHSGTTTFKLEQRFLGIDSVPNDQFGRAVSVRGNTIAVGNKNAAYVFARSGLTWAQQAKLTVSDPETGDQLGFAVAVDGDTVLTGAPDKGTEDRGAVYVHRFLLPKGDACTTAAQCLSNFCIDGVCCDRACDGQCEACDVATFIGTCRTISGAPHGTRTACAGDGSECGQRTCNGVDATACQFPGTTKPCSAAACTGGIETHVGKCTGTGACDDVPKSCGAYKCGTTACGTSCVASSDCAAGYYCKSNACVPLEGLGTPCSSTVPCASGLFCTDGVCCGVAACGAGETCAYTGKTGACSKSDGSTCANNAECGSGRCVDGVCCNSACSGQCEACDVAASPGKCTPVSGKPHGVRMECDTGGTDVCKALTCDGARDATKCVGFAKGSETECKVASCAGSSFTAASTCDMGACKTPTATSCVPYACNDKGCLAECASDSDCAMSYRCQDKKCVEGAQCSGDKLSSIGKDGAPSSCAPYRCGPDGNCLNACNTSEDCAPGSVCNPGTKVCEQPATDAGDDGGGCGCRVGARGGNAGVALLVLLAFLATRRRTR